MLEKPTGSKTPGVNSRKMFSTKDIVIKKLRPAGQPNIIKSISQNKVQQLQSLKPLKEIKKLSIMAQNLVTCQEDQIKQVSENTTFDLIENIPVFLKVLLPKKGSIFLSKQKYLKVYLSDTIKKPK